MGRFTVWPMLAVAVVSARVEAGIILQLEQESLRNIAGTSSYMIDARIRLNDDANGADLSAPPRVSSVNVSMSLDPVVQGQAFKDLVAPVKDAIFPPATSSYNYGAPEPSSIIYGSVISNAAATDPSFSDGEIVFTLGLERAPTVEGRQEIKFAPSADAGTFYTLNGGGGEPVAFDAVVSAYIPEPNSLTLILTAGVVWMRFLRRRLFSGI